MDRSARGTAGGRKALASRLGCRGPRSGRGGRGALRVVVDAAGNTLLEHVVEAGDIWRACQVKDAAVRDWVKRNDLRVAYRMFSDEVRKIDPTRMICYGDATPSRRSYNSHFNGTWDVDTREQWMMMFKGDNIGADCESIHVYPYQDGSYFPEKAPIEELIKLCNSTGKPLFIGEFGAPEELGAEGARTFYDRLIKVILEERVPLSDLWVFDLDKQEGIWNVTHENDRAYMLDTIMETNRKFKEMLSE